MIISNQVGAIHYQDQRSCSLTSSRKRHLLQLVERSLNVKQGSGVSRTSDAEQTSDIAVESL
jgi:hypothetical protein